MTNREAIDILKVLKELHIVDPELIDTNDICALELAIKALTKEAKIEERKAKEKAEQDKIKARAVFYQDLQEGELFRITIKLNDKRIFRKDREGATEIKNSYGDPCNYKEYPYLTMIVYRLE